MITESIPQKLKYSQSPESNLKTLKKPLSGYFKLDLQQAWPEFIDSYKPYQWYSTHTFKDDKHPEAADKAFFRWIRSVNQDLYGRRYREKGRGVTWVKAIERQKRGVLHFHCLVGSSLLYKLDRKHFMKLWETDGNMGNKIVNGFARIYEFDTSRGAVSYLSKYVLKDGEIDVYVSPEQLRAFNNTKPTLDLKFMN